MIIAPVVGTDAKRFGPQRRGGPKPGPDLERVLRLPRREVPTQEQQAEMARVLTVRLRRDNPNCRCRELGAQRCITDLLPIQGWYLYEAALYGGVIGHVAVGRGKCLAAGSEVFDAARGRRFDISECLLDLSVPSVGEQGLGLETAAGFASGSKPCWRVELANGARLDASWDHPILTARGWVRANQLLRTDFVAVPRWAPAPESPVAASDAEVSLMALLLADGGLNGPSMRFTNATPAVVEEFLRCVEAVCDGAHKDSSKSSALEFSIQGGRAFRERWGLFGLAREKRAHADVWGLSTAHVRLFLNRFWACDGYVAKDHLELTLASEKLVDDVQFLLLRLGVRSRKRAKTATLNGTHFKAWRISISGADALRFLEEVGPVLGKEAACAAYLARLHRTARNTNTDLVPVGYAEVMEIFDELGWPRKGPGMPKGKHRTKAIKALGATRGQYVSRDKFERFCVEYSYRGKYSGLLRRGVAWERLEALTPLGELPVYDLTVPATQNFVANGMIVHNTGIDILSPMVLPRVADRPLRCVLLVPPQLRDQFRHDFELWSQHFQTPNLAGGNARTFTRGRPTLDVLAYSELSHQKCAVWLNSKAPDVIICDEAQALADPSSTRSGRFLDFFADNKRHGGEKLLAHSGSLTTDSVTQYAHLAALALQENSPLPLESVDLAEWAEALDPGPRGGEPVSGPGALKALMREGEPLRHAFRRVLRETPGVVISDDARLPVKISIHERKVAKVPDAINVALDMVRSGERPDHERLEEAHEVASCARQVSAGFFYHWRFPRGEPVELIEEWFAKRKAWHAEVRRKLEYRREWLDSPGLLKAAAERALLAREEVEIEGPAWESAHWAAWKAIEPQVQPVEAFKWIDDFLARDAVAWGREHVGIIWYEHKAWGRRVAELGRFPLYEGGDEASAGIRAERGDRTIVASIKAHGTGKNLQAFNRALIGNSPSNGGTWEQTLGREYRTGQTSDVLVWVYRHTPEVAAAFDQACADARYVLETTGKADILTYAERSF